jgi:thiamine pyrophosphokinase
MNMLKDKYEAVIVAGGEYPTTPIALKILNEAPYVVCCDGAADAYISRGGVPDAIVGDGDSISVCNRERYADRLHIFAEQETNDQTKAMRFLHQMGKRHIAIVGATGGREDHTLGNISLLIEYARMGCRVHLYTDHGVFIPCRDTVTLPSHPGQQLSIFSITAHGFRATGLRYPLYDFTNWWQGTLNECTADQFTIHAQGEYILFLNYFTP